MKFQNFVDSGYVGLSYTSSMTYSVPRSLFSVFDYGMLKLFSDF